MKALPLLASVAALVVGFGFGIASRDGSGPDATASPATAAKDGRAAAPADDPLAAVRLALRRKPGLRDFAALGGPLGKLSASQLAELLVELEHFPGDPSRERARWLFRWWAERDPEAAFASAMPRIRMVTQDGKYFYAAQLEAEMTRLWMKAFPDRALEFIRAQPRSGWVPEFLESAVAQKGKPGSEAWQILRDFPEGRGRAKAAAQFIAGRDGWAYQDAAAAFQAAQALPAGQTRDAALAAALPVLAGQDAATAFAHYDKLGLADPPLLTEMIAGAAGKDPAGMADWILQIDRVQFMQAAPLVVEKWAARDPVAALTWALEHEVALHSTRIDFPETSHAGLSRITSGPDDGDLDLDPLRTGMKAKPDETLAWLRALPAGGDRDQFAIRMLRVAKVEQAIALLEELPPAARPDAASTIAGKLAPEPARAAAWAGSLPEGPVRERAWSSLGLATRGEPPNLPPGPDRDAWLVGRIGQIAGNFEPANVSTSLDLVLQINDPAKRRDFFDKAAKHYHDVPTTNESLQVWLGKAGIPDDWKAKWRKK